jgi:ubiquinone/menaquinone biosynthesis C-methylase UbiE
MPAKDGSYTFDGFTDPARAAEAARLQHQAALLLPIEEEIWLEVGLQPGMQVVDVGCGVGSIACQMAKRIGSGRVLGIDRSETLLEIAAGIQAKNQLTNISFQAGDVYNLPLASGIADFVYARLLFQHLTDPLAALAEIDRILKPGGKVCIVDTADGWFYLDPEPPAFSALRQRLLTERLALGGDPDVGKKLGSYLAKAGFTAIRSTVKVVTSDRLGGIGKFLELLSFGNPYQSSDGSLNDLVASARQETASLDRLAYASAGFGFFVVTAMKI